MLTRRTFTGLIATIAATFSVNRALATDHCTTGNCSGNQTCCPGYTCVPTGNGNSKTCQPDDALVLCIVDFQCPDDAVCRNGVCCTAMVTTDPGGNQITIYVPITNIIYAPPTGGGGHHHRHNHHHHNRRNKH